MRTEESHETGTGSLGGQASVRASSTPGRRRPWVKPAVRVRPLPEVVRGATGSKPDAFGQSNNLPGG
jgi:hypothetical protein